MVWFERRRTKGRRRRRTRAGWSTGRRRRTAASTAREGLPALRLQRPLSTLLRPALDTLRSYPPTFLRRLSVPSPSQRSLRLFRTSSAYLLFIVSLHPRPFSPACIVICRSTPPHRAHQIHRRDHRRARRSCRSGLYRPASFLCGPAFCCTRVSSGDGGCSACTGAAGWGGDGTREGGERLVCYRDRDEFRLARGGIEIGGEGGGKGAGGGSGRRSECCRAR